jgi:tRNA threonylcarbamoyladenosine biosynthesis protein TsaB
VSKIDELTAEHALNPGLHELTSSFEPNETTMRILALESSSNNGSIAVLEDDCVLDESLLDPGQRTAQSFAPAIGRQLEAVGWRPEDIQMIAVTRGPGSFTGLRIGVTAAKTLAYAVGAEVLGVDTLQVIARQAPAVERPICVLADAQRQQVFAARFRRCGDALNRESPTEIIGNDAWLAGLPADAMVIGPGLKRLRDRLPDGISVADPQLWTPRASTVGLVAGIEYRAGKRDDLWKLNPSYYRKSAAEEKHEATLEASG